ncbi:MAG: four-helix bundle copper-binding protein [Bryobacterales bacterium]
MPHKIDNAMRECIRNCQECHAICTETVAHCLVKGGKHAGAEHIRLLLDCAEICATSADFMLRASPDHVRTCGVCAELCSQCAESCEQLGKGDQTMTQCAELCRRCAQSCEQMAGVRA